MDAPRLPGRRHYEIFDCAMGSGLSKPMGHVRMMAAAQPSFSGADQLRRSNLPETGDGVRTRRTHLPRLEARAQGTRGLSRQLQGRPAVLHRRAKKAVAEPEVIVENRPTRTRLPKTIIADDIVPALAAGPRAT